MNPHWRMDRNSVFEVIDRAWHNADAVTFDGHISNGMAAGVMQPWFDCAAVRWYTMGDVPRREWLP